MEKSIYDYPAVDFTPLLVPGKLFAVRCESEEEAKNLIAAMQIQFPNKCRHLTLENNSWNNDNHGNGGGRAYYPDVNDADGDWFMTGDVYYARESNYTIVPFKDLLIEDVPLEESDMSLTDLVGWLS